MTKRNTVTTQNNLDGSVTFTRRHAKPVISLEDRLSTMITDYKRSIQVAIETANDNLHAELAELVDVDEYSAKMVWDALEAMDDSINVGNYKIVNSLSEVAVYALESCTLEELSNLENTPSISLAENNPRLAELEDKLKNNPRLAEEYENWVMAATARRR